MDAEERESGITFGELCHLIGKRIWLVLGIAAAAAVLFAVLFALVFNPMTTYYSMSFELVYPSSAARQYPDGTPFSYRNIISRTMLEAAKKKDERLSGVDVARMIEEDHISVSAQTQEDDETVIYTINVKGSYFHDEETAQLFIRSVADATVDDIMARAAAVSYSISEETFNGNNFEARLDLLSELYETLLSVYDGWISAYSAGYQVTVGTARPLADYRAEVYGVFVEGVRDSLATECENGGYSLLYGDEEAIVVTEAVDARVRQLYEEYVLNEKIMQALRELSSQGTVVLYAASEQASGKAEDTAPSQPAESVSQLLAHYTERNAIIASQLGSAVDGVSEPDGTLTVARATAFAQQLDGYFTKLNAAAETLSDVTTAIYRQNTFAEFVSQNADSSGDTSVILVAVAAFVVVFLIAAIAVCAVSYADRRKAQEGASVQPPADKEE